MQPLIRSIQPLAEGTAIETQAGTYWVSSRDAAGHVSFQAHADRSALDSAPDHREDWTQLRGEQLWFWNGHELVACSATPPLALQSWGAALSRDGTVFGYDEREHRYCEAQQLGALGPVIGTSSPICGILTNSLVLTESTLLGTVGCALD